MGCTMKNNPDINPIWDSFMGATTDTAMIRALSAILIFIIAGGIIAWTIA